MIKRFRDTWLKNFYIADERNKRMPADLETSLFRKLQLVDDAAYELDLRSPPSNHFEKLSGKLAGKHSIKVNRQWRLIFEWDGKHGEADNIYLDNHSYR